MKTLDEIIDECQKERADKVEMISCPIDCQGCTCFVSPPCSHCVEGHGLMPDEGTGVIE